MTDNKQMKPATRCVHAGTRLDVETGGLISPIVSASAFDYLDQGEVRYPRYYNLPNQQAVVDKLCALEGAEAGLLMSSGMAAISALFTGLLESGDHVVLLEGLYGGTHDWVVNEFPRRGVEYSLVAPDAAAIEAACKSNTRLVFVESPTNPLLRLVDLEAVARMASQRSIFTAIDNTFASPVAQTPLALGFDLVMHSATKYLGGHSDLCAGLLVGSRALIERLRPHAIRYGGNVNAQTAALLERSMKTLQLRVERQSDNAERIAWALCEWDGIREVHYPGLSHSGDYDLARRQMRCFGGMISFVLDIGRDPLAFQRALGVIAPAVSLGGVDSSICQPTLTSHAKMPEQERQRLGIHPGLLRLSVGIEHVEDLLADLAQGLAAAG